MRQLTSTENERLEYLTQRNIELTLIEPTKTGLGKSILDATGLVRSYLDDQGVHDYSIQGKGGSHKVIIDSELLYEDRIIESKASLYRPVTKKGDPRIWFKHLGKLAEPNDIIAIISHDKKLKLINLSKVDFLALPKTSPVSELINDIYKTTSSVSEELLKRMYQIAKMGPVKSLVNADTGIGRTLETLLGIDINSSKLPDYKGIELKSYRAKRTNRKNLFAQVPDWKISKFKSSNEILENFGYWRDDEFRLYCTVSTINTNSQGLSLDLDLNIEQLKEKSDRKEIGYFAVWELSKLHNRLQEKHNETFWIQAESSNIDGHEYYQYNMVEHTRKPSNSQFNLLLSQGDITMDHLIKRTKTGGAKEKGPIFKIKPHKTNLLFPPSKIYNLLD